MNWEPMEGGIVEEVTYARALSRSERRAVSIYVSLKWGISVTRRDRLWYWFYRRLHPQR